MGIDALANLAEHLIDHAALDVKSQSDLDSRFVNETGDTMTGALLGFITVDTKANILALSPASNQLAFATDTDEFYLYDSNDSEWKVAPLQLKAEASAPDMGAYNIETAGSEAGLGVSDKMGYYDGDITDQKLHNVTLLGNANETEGSIRTTTGGVFQVYLNGVWNDVVINFVMREDSDGTYELEHAPVGFDWYYEIMSGNSDELDIDGNPLIQQYTANMGCYSSNLHIDGGTF